MATVIVGVDHPLTIGQVRTDGTYIRQEGERYKQPMRIVREATFEEWLQAAREDLGREPTPRSIARARLPTSRFYEIESD